MSMTDPIADMLARIRNAQMAGHESLTMPRSNIKVEIAKILSNEGFIEGFVEDQRGPQGHVKVFLKYDTGNRGIIRGLRRVSKPSRRVYVGKDEIPRLRGLPGCGCDDKGQPEHPGDPLLHQLGRPGPGSPCRHCKCCHGARSKCERVAFAYSEPVWQWQWCCA